MTRKIAFRRLTSDDLQQMREMLAMFGRVFDDLPTYTDRQPSDRYLADLLASDTFIALAALDRGAVIGGLAAYVLPKFEQARREIHLYDLAVAESHRRRGVATSHVPMGRRRKTMTRPDTSK